MLCYSFMTVLPFDWHKKCLSIDWKSWTVFFFFLDNGTISIWIVILSGYKVAKKKIFKWHRKYSDTFFFRWSIADDTKKQNFFFLLRVFVLLLSKNYRQHTQSYCKIDWLIIVMAKKKYCFVLFCWRNRVILISV